MKKMKFILIGAVLALTLTAASCTKEEDTDTTTNSTTEDTAGTIDNQDDTTTPATATTTVTMDNLAFSPKSIEISAGDSVTFTNNENMIHTADVASLSFESGDLSNGDSTTITFDKVGSYTVACKYHPTMRATVIVK